MKGFGCDNCWSSNAADAWAAIKNVPIDAYLIDESHFIVSVRACPSCAQGFLQVTTEMVGWTDGDDPIFRTVIPIDGDERERLLACQPPTAAMIESIGIGRRSLRCDWSNDGVPRTYWSTGISVGLHD